ncbi:MAG: sensor histidine kinase, partial [Anaerolineaceae bacterium]|nr:sensor histidine kinase [Anaerolineaceae bacterium]
TGIGISKTSLPYIFEAFWRWDEARTTPGFGLGLTIAQKIVQMHDGNIDVTSEVGQGTVIRVILPVATDSI